MRETGSKGNVIWKRFQQDRSAQMKQDAARQISRAANMIRRKMSEFSTLDGLTFTQTRVLYFILRNCEEIYQKDIEEEYMFRAPTATALLKSLEEAGLIERTPAEHDARKKRIRPTEKALALRDKAEKEIEQLEECVTKGIPQEDLDTFNRIIEQMIRNLQEESSRR